MNEECNKFSRNDVFITFLLGIRHCRLRAIYITNWKLSHKINVPAAKRHGEHMSSRDVVCTTHAGKGSGQRPTPYMRSWKKQRDELQYLWEKLASMREQTTKRRNLFCVLSTSASRFLLLVCRSLFRFPSQSFSKWFLYLKQQKQQQQNKQIYLQLFFFFC